jgi:hypothetical protein
MTVDTGQIEIGLGAAPVEVFLNTVWNTQRRAITSACGGLKPRAMKKARVWSGTSLRLVQRLPDHDRPALEPRAYAWPDRARPQFITAPVPF